MYNEGMRFEVPQFIEIEDKIIGPLTWKQFVYLAGGAGVIVVTFLALPFFLFVIIGLPIGILAGFLAFHKVNNRPFATFLESVVDYSLGNKLYLWRKRSKSVISQQEETPAVGNTPVQESHLPQAETSSISSMSRKLEIDALEIKE
jgi:hypothetical protein